MSEFGAFLRHTYYHPLEYWGTDAGRIDMDAHLEGRLAEFRVTYIPWLDRVAALDGLRVLEIGCGTGASTVALAEQGARVTGVDVDESSLVIARRRCELYGVTAELVLGDASTVHASVPVEDFDLVVFFAALEHMTHEERLGSIAAYWQRLRPGALMAVVDTPNRLWYFDHHTSYLNFFHWLPDEIAHRYTRFCSHDQIKRLHSTEGGMLQLQRWGRGISFHEFDLAIGDVRALEVAASFRPFQRRREPLRLAKWWVTPDRRYHRVLRSIATDLDPVWLEPYLDLVLRKPSGH